MTDQPRVSIDAVALMRQAEEVEELNKNVEVLAQALRERPTRQEVARKRRATFMLAISFAAVIIFAHDEHVEHCGPGRESKAAVSYIINLPPNEPVDRERLRESVKDATSNFCGVTFPLHTHDDEQGWPGNYNMLGFLAYFIFFAGGWTWALRREPNPSDRRAGPPQNV